MNRGIPMANSKSNIYPIQLQGAELCLNRYDAEIKQYRGFNKNNSPFVGGCLSNVFEKDETIEGATDENTIITENGDIYRINENGDFYKNNNFLFETSGYGYSLRKLESNSNIIKYFDDDIYVFKKEIDNSIYYYLKYGENEEAIGIEYQITPDYPYTQWQEFEQKGLCGVFVKENTETDSYIFLFACRVLNKYILISIVRENGEFSLGSVVTQSGTGDIRNFFSPVSLCYNETKSQILYFATNCNTWEKNKDSDCYFDICMACSLADNGEITFLNGVTNLASSPDSNFTLLSTSIVYYYFCSYPYNKIILKKGGASTSLNNKKMLVLMDDPYYENGLIKYTIPAATTIEYNINFALYGNRNVKGVGKYNLKKDTLTPLVCDFDLQLQVDTNSSFCCHFNPNMYYGLGFNFKDVENGNETYKACSYAMGDAFKYKNTDFSLLFNNNLLSGIGGDFVLFEGWNNIDVWSLSFSMGKVYYKINNETFVIEKGVVSLKKYLNQIVLNIDSIINSYDVIKNKKLLFAPVYNSLYLVVGASTVLDGAPYSFYEQGNNTFIAGAVNEYNQEDNSSIILNPVSIAVPEGIASDIFYIQSFFSGVVNIYFAQNSTEILYKNSIKNCQFFNPNSGDPDIGEKYDSFIFYNKELEGLPFPIDTNGNVEYSPSLFSEIKSVYGNQAFIKDSNTFYPLVLGNESLPIMSFYMASGVDNFENGFIIQGQFYGILNNSIYTVAYMNGVITGVSFILSVEGLQFIGNTPYEALFFSKTNRCLYSFTGANVLNQKQLVDKISEVRNYLYNPATQTVFLITDIGVLFYGLFGMFLLEYTNISNIFLLDNGIVMSDNSGNYRYIKYYLDEGDTDYTKENINVETSFYGMNNEVVTINDCLYFRIFSEEHEEGDLKVSATTISLSGRKTEETTFKIKASDWDKITHTIYLRYQPKTQRGLGVAFAIDSPFKIASLSVGSQPDAVLVDKVSKGAITAPSVTTNNNEW